MIYPEHVPLTCFISKHWSILLYHCSIDRSITRRFTKLLTWSNIIHVYWRDVQRKNVVNNVDMSSLRPPWQNGLYKNQYTEHTKTQRTPRRNRNLEKNSFFAFFQKLKCQVQHIDIVHLTTSYVKIVRLFHNKSLKYLELNMQIPT